MNVTETHRGGLRGLHAEEMVKLVAVVAGEAFAAYVDLRPASATYGTVVTTTLRPGVQVLVPKGVGNGFQATGEGGCAVPLLLRPRVGAGHGRRRVHAARPGPRDRLAAARSTPTTRPRCRRRTATHPLLAELAGGER